MEFRSHVGGVHDKLDEDCSGEFDGGFILTGYIEDVGFQYDSRPSRLKYGLPPGTYLCVLKREVDHKLPL